MKKIVFLDRDGVINQKALPHQYIQTVSQFIFNPEIFTILEGLKKQGFEFIVLTNQRGIARGMLTEQNLKEINDYMKLELHSRGIELLDIFYCPHDENSCDCRKPKPGLLRQAVEKYDINLADSILISDSDEDIKMGKNFGIGKNFFVVSNRPSIYLFNND